MTLTRKFIYVMFAQTLVLLLLYVPMLLLTAVKFLPDDPLALAIPYHHAQSFSSILLQLALLTGLTAGGLYLIVAQRTDATLKYEHIAYRLYQAWTIGLILGVVAGALNLAEGRHLLELPPILDAVFILLQLAFLILAGMSLDKASLAQDIRFSAADGTSRTPWNAFALVWGIGMALNIMCQSVGLLPAQDYLQDRIFRTLASGLQWNVAFVLMALAILFWLMPRFSTVTSAWAESGLNRVGGVMSIVGVLVSMAALAHLPGAIPEVGNITLVVAPLLGLMFVAHGYQALSQRSASYTLAAHWVALSVVLLFSGLCIVGGILAAPAIQQVAQGTHLTDMQFALVAFGILAAILGLINQAVAEMRGHNARITGLLPFWLIGAGMMGSSLALTLAGVVQVYMERLLSIGYLDTQAALLPLHLLWIIALLLLAPGMAFYALGFRARQL
jgi:nitric oxide reductase subunit B